MVTCPTAIFTIGIIARTYDAVPALTKAFFSGLHGPCSGYNDFMGFPNRKEAGPKPTGVSHLLAKAPTVTTLVIRLGRVVAVHL